MFEKTKEFYEEHKKEIIVAGGVILTVGTCVILGKAMKPKGSAVITILDDLPLYDNSAERAILEGFGAVYQEGNPVPFATKEVAMKFLEERGKTYQLDILDGLNGGVIWISE